MSLFTDLREVFTAYAQRIKSLAAADEEIKADLATLADITPIPDNSDLNNYGETGLYSIEYGNYTILNYPQASVVASYLEVRKMTTGYVGQKLTIPGTGKVFTRRRFDNGTWIAWRQIGVEISNDLMTQGKAADSKKTGDAISALQADLTTLADVTPIPDNSDLNNYVETGLYSIEYSSYTILHYPVETVATSYLEITALTTGYIVQKLTTGTGNVFIRRRYSNGNWTDWMQIARNISTAQVFTDEIKTAIFNAFEHVGWEDTNGEKYYYNLYNALNGTIFKYPVPGNKYNVVTGGTENVNIDEDLTRVVITNQSLTARKTVGLKYGTLKLVESATLQPVDVYPIPIPDNATGVRVTYTTVSGATVRYQFITMIVHPSSDEYYKLAKYGNWLSSGEIATIDRVSWSNMFGILNFDGNSESNQNFRNVQIEFS